LDRSSILVYMQVLASKLSGAWVIDSSNPQNPLIAVVHEAILDPSTLQVVLFSLRGSRDTSAKHYVRAQQSHIAAGVTLIIKTSDNIGSADDFVREKLLLEKTCTLFGYLVVTSSGKKLGRVTDYSLSSQLMRVEKLHVMPPLWQRLHSAERILPRSIILDVDMDKRLIKVKDDKAQVRSRATQAIPA